MRRHGFSMVELIVVMGIVALLASLLFPVLAATKSKAGETVCMSNLKQLGTAMLMYKDEEGEFPWRGGLIDNYLGHAKLRCPQKVSTSAYNFSAYENIAAFAAPAKNDFVQKILGSMHDCLEIRGPQYPLVADRNHLPKIMRPDDQLYGVVLVFRLSGAVERVSKSRAANIVLANGGLPTTESLPCKASAQDANL